MHRFWDSVTRPLLDTIDVSSIVEIGVEDGQHTELLLPYAEKHGATLHCIDPVAPKGLEMWREKFPDTLKFYETLSVQALPSIAQYDVVLIDGDHNWYTVHRELMEIDRRAKSMAQFPMILLHDTGWPYGRRDLYCDPQNIPASERQPYAMGGVHRDFERLDPEGLNANYAHAETSVGPRNGVLSAIEDFLKQSTEDLFFLNLTGLHGLGIVVSRKRLRTNEALTLFIKDITPSHPLITHLSSLEDDRLHSMLRETHVQRQNARLSSDLKVLELTLSQLKDRIKTLEEERDDALRLMTQAQAYTEELTQRIHGLEELAVRMERVSRDSERQLAMSQTHIADLEKEKIEWEVIRKQQEMREVEWMKKMDRLQQEKERMERDLSDLHKKHMDQLSKVRAYVQGAEEHWQEKNEAYEKTTTEQALTIRQLKEEQEILHRRILEEAKRSEDAKAHLEQLDEKANIWTQRAEAEQKKNEVLGTQYGTEIRRLEQLLAHMEDTKSWKMTAPLRKAEVILRRDVRTVGYSTIALCRHLWIATGEPFPKTARWIRLRVLGKVWPMRPSITDPQYLPMPQASETVLPQFSNQSDVSVIVASRNYGQFLKECLTSIVNQTVAPKEIIYVDDGSTDDSVKIASEFKEVRVLSLVHRGAPAARNSGVKASTGSLILHVDGDDVLPLDFLETHLKTLQSTPGALFAYGPAQAFGMHNTFWDAPEWSRDTLWLQNFVNTSALVYKSVFEKIGGWREDLETMWDWDLWLRLSKLGSGVRSRATILYRQHAESWGHTHELAKSEEELGELMGSVRRGILRISICCVFSGRLPALFPIWLDALAASVRASHGAAKPDLIFLDHSEAQFLAQRKADFERHQDIFGTVTIVPYREKLSWNTETERRDAVASFLARACSKLLSLSDAEVVWFLEDDIVVPVHACAQLQKTLTDGIRPKAAVTGLYISRHVEETVVHVLNSEGHPSAVSRHVSTLLRVDLAPTGCLMILRPVARHTFRSHWKGSVPAHDWAWSEDLKNSGHDVWLDPSVLCRHYVTAEEYV